MNQRIICLVGFSLFMAVCGAERQPEVINTASQPETIPPPAAIANSKPIKVSQPTQPVDQQPASETTLPSLKPSEQASETTLERTDNSEKAIDDLPNPEEQANDQANEGDKRILILGDSLAATGFGVLLEKRLEEHPQVRCFRKAKSASGLARPDFFDWIKTAQTEVKKHNPDLVIVILGGNDGQDLAPSSGKGNRVHWQSEDWEEAYRQRTDELLTQISAENRQILWLGLPKMGLQSFEKKLSLIRTIQQDAITEFGERAIYLDTIPMTSDAKGELQKVADVGSKKNQRLREDDGIHFTMAGSAYFADQVYPKALEQLNLSP